MFAFPLTATWEPTPRAVRMMADLSDSVKAARGQLKGALGYSEAMFSRFLQLHKPSMLARLAEDEAVEREFIRRRAEHHGLRILPADVAELLEDVLRKKRMARAAHLPDSRKADIA